MASAERVGGRRWTLRLDGGGAIQLPASRARRRRWPRRRRLLASGFGAGRDRRARGRPGDCARGAAAPAKPGGQRPRPAADATGCEDVRLGGWRVASQHKLRRQTPAILGLLDIGTSKTVCFIVAAARRRREAPVEVLGVGQQPSRGLKAGVVIELDAAEQCVRAAVTEAERAAGCELRQVLLAVASAAAQVSDVCRRSQDRGPRGRRRRYGAADGGRTQLCGTRRACLAAHERHRLPAGRCRRGSPIRAASPPKW